MTAQTLKRPYSTSHRLEAERAERARMTDESRGYSPAVRATLAWVITATEPAAKGTNLSNWQDEFLWRAARAAFAKNRQALDNLHDGIGLRLTHGEAIAIYNGVMASHCDSLPTGRDAFEILDTATPGLGDAVKCLVYEVKLHPWCKLMWKLTSTPEDPYRPIFKPGHWFCLPWA